MRIVYIAGKKVADKPKRETTHERCIKLVKKLEADDLIRARKEYAKELKDIEIFHSTGCSSYCKNKVEKDK